ncbi:hypothetical protein ACET3Z_013498 [Daucus carota]
MASLSQIPSIMCTITLSQTSCRKLNLRKTFDHRFTFLRRTVCCTKSSPWEPSPVTYALTDGTADEFLKETPNIFQKLNSNKTIEASLPITEELADENKQSTSQLQYLRWPLWLLGPLLLLVTGIVPTLWLPISSIFLGPNIASLLSLTGLDCIFNLGASLFLLMADSCARPETSTRSCISQAPLSYRYWNIIASVAGYIIPLSLIFCSQSGLLQPQLSFISYAVLLGPYLLLLTVQILTEMLTWHWQSPVWLVTPVVYETYRVLQLMRGLKLGAELGSPGWMMHALRGLVCWWVVVLGMQLMRVAWYAGFTATTQQKLSTTAVSEES